MQLTVSISDSAFRWLNAYAEANGVTPETFLEQAAFCVADYAGRRPGSWEAEVGEKLASAMCANDGSIRNDKMEELRQADKEEK